MILCKYSRHSARRMAPVPTEVVLEKCPARSMTVTVTVPEGLIIMYELGEILEMLDELSSRREDTARGA